MKVRLKAKPKIILLMQFYDPEPAYKGQSFAEAIVKAGYDVEVVTGFPNYPGGKVYDGYRIKPIQKDVVNGVKLTRVALYPSHNRSKLGRVLNYVSFAISAFIYLTIYVRSTDIVYVYSPPATVGIAATAARLIRRFPVVIDIHDLWPDTLPATGMLTNPRLLKIIDSACNWMYLRVNHIVLHSNGFRHRLLKRGVPPEKMTSIIGWTNEKKYEGVHSVPPSSIINALGLKVLYAGNIGPAQALNSVIDAAKLLKDAGEADAATFFFLGSGLAYDSLKLQATELNLQNVRFLPRVSQSEASAYLVSADVLLVHLRNDPLFSITMPSKTQAYMLAGKPILMGVRGEAKKLIESANAGIAVPPENSQALANAVRSLIAMPEKDRLALGHNARKFYWQNLSMEKGMEKFFKVFQDVHRG